MKQIGWLVYCHGIIQRNAPFNDIHTRLTDADKSEGWTEQAVYVEEPSDTFTDPQGNVWTRPTAWAYYAACRANNFRRDAFEKIREILNERVPEDAPATVLHCQYCGGNGLVSRNDRIDYTCHNCNGSGRATGETAIVIPRTEQCPDCAGTGYESGNVPRHATIGVTCKNCHGNGFVIIKQKEA